MLKKSIIVFSICFFLLCIGDLRSQNINANTAKKMDDHIDLLFDNDDILHFKLTGRLKILFNDRKSNMVYHPMLLWYKQNDNNFKINLKVKTRGNFRRDANNCKMPPLMLNFSYREELKGSVFENQKKLKLVVPCGNDEYVIRELLVYKLYNLLSEKSFRAKLVQVEFEDSISKKTETHYCFLLEDEDKLAKRNKSIVWDKKMLSMQGMEKNEFQKMAVFQYMIGNTDWSVPYLQNIKLITSDSTRSPVAVPYDFDHAGIVDADYAKPAPELELSSIRERLYRGFCVKDLKEFEKTFDLFRKLKNDFYKIYNSNSLLSGKYLKFSLRFLDDFYEVINNNKAIDKEFGNPCRTDVRIEIKGLK